MQPKRRRSGGAESSWSPFYFPDNQTPWLPIELIAKILSCLPVKTLIEFKSVCTSWNSLISEPHFANQHLRRQQQQQRRRSAPNTTNLLFQYQIHDSDPVNISSIPVSSLLLEASSIARKTRPLLSFHGTTYNAIKLLGSCNGLVCLCEVRADGCRVGFCNPATRSMSKTSPKMAIRPRGGDFGLLSGGFGHDHVSGTYKAVLFLNDNQERNQVKVFSMGVDTNWRDIGFFPHLCSSNKLGIYLNGTLNWVADDVKHGKWKRGSKSLMIISFDLNKEDYVELSLPPQKSFVFLIPYLCILGDCLCVSYDHNGIYLVVWQMNRFGDDGSWTKLLNLDIQCQFLRFPVGQFPFGRWFPLCIFDNCSVLLLQQNLLYIQREKRWKPLQIPDYMGAGLT